KLPVSRPSVVPRRTERQGLDCAICDLTKRIGIDTGAGEFELELEAVLVEHGLKIAVGTVLEHRSPVRLRVSIELVKQEHDVHAIEQCSDAVGQPSCRTPQGNPKVLIDLVADSC